jgi:hypothetical protein
MSTITCYASAPRLSRTPPPAAGRASLPTRARVSARQPASPLRLTRRGRLLLTLLCLALAVTAVVLLNPPATASSTLEPKAGPVAERVTVRPGETLWAIAERARPGADPRATIARIKDMNGLTSSALPAGSVLLVPAAR